MLLQADTETKLFEDFRKVSRELHELTVQNAGRERAEKHKELSTITRETELFTDIKDIRYQLNIILTVLKDQENALRALTSIINETKISQGKEGAKGSEAAKPSNAMYDKQYRVVNTNKKDFEMMQEHAKEIYDSVNTRVFTR